MADAIPPPESLDPWELHLLEDVVRGFLSTRNTSREEFDDLVQEVALHWVARRDRYDEKRRASIATYLRRVSNAKLIDIERFEQAHKRGGKLQPLSLDLTDPDGRSLADLLPDEVRREELAGALNRALSRLSGLQQRIVKALGDSVSKTDAARHVGISRDVLYKELSLIQSVFRDEGLDEFLH